MIPRLLLPPLLAAAFALACSGSASAPPPAKSPAASPSVIFPDGWSVQVALATTPEQQARGLMFVDNLPADRGMLFLFDTDEARPFWMKDCLVPLDMVWLDAQFRVADISRDVQPCPGDPCPSVYPDRPIRNVLEVQAGLCAAHRLAVGDRLAVVNLPATKAPGS